MARGGRRPGSGRKPKQVAELQLMGAFRPARHAHLLKPSFAAASEAWSPTAAQVAGQGAAGRVFVEQMVAANELTDREGAIVLELGHVVTALASVRTIARDGMTLKDRGAMDRIEMGWARTFASLMAMLRLTT